MIKILHDLIQNDGSGPNKEITANDIVKTFLNNFEDSKTAKYYLENYWQSGDFQDNLRDFNRRRELVINGDYEKFIKNEYNGAYTRFFKDAMGILRSLTALSDIRGYAISNVFTIDDIYYLKRIFNI